jgi:MFS family permease
VALRRLLSIRDARLYLAGQTFSAFGDSALWLAMAVWVKQLTHSSGAAGATFFFFFAPTLLAPVWGVVVDRRRRRPLLIATNTLTGVAVLALLLVHGVGQVWLIYLVMVVYGSAYAVLGAAQSALLVTMVPAELLADANGAIRAIQGTQSLIAPLTGAGLFALLGAHAVVILDAATFVVAVAALRALRLSEPPPRPPDRRWGTELAAGIRHIARTPILRQVITASICAVLGFGFSETVVFAVAGTGLHEAPSFVGVLVAIQGIGSIVAGPTAAKLVKRIGEPRLIATGLLVAALGALLELAPLLPSVVAGVFVTGLSISWVIVALMTLVQRSTPPQLQGRVYTAADALITTPQTISIAVGAAVIGVVGYRALLGGMAAADIVAAGYLLAPRGATRARFSPCA